MKGIKTRVTTAELVGQAIIKVRPHRAYPCSQEIEAIWDEVVHHDTYGDASLAWVAAIRESEVIGNADALFKAVKRYIRKRTPERYL
jgi:hypothetical protein